MWSSPQIIMFRIKKIYLILVILISQISIVQAIEYELPPSIIKSKITDSYTVTEIEITNELRARTTLSAILDSTLGISLNKLGSNYQTTTVSIRGSKSAGVLVMLDGVPLNLLNESVDLSNISLANIKKIIIYPGSVSSKFGFSGFSGAINLLTVAKKEDQLAYFKYGSFQSFEQGLNFSISQLNSNIYFNHVYSRGDFPFMNNHGTPENPKNNTMDIRNNNEIDQCYFGYKANQIFNDLSTFYFGYSAAKKGVPGTIYNPSLAAYKNENKSFFNFKTQNLEFLPNQMLSFDLNYQIVENNFFDPNKEFSPIAENNSYYTHAFRGFVENNLIFETFNFKTSLSASRETLSRNIYFPSTKLGTYTLFPNRNLFDFNLETNFFNLKPNLIFNLNYANYLNENDFLTASFSTIFELNPNLLLKTHIGNSYRMPSYSEKYIAWGPYYNNPNLKPENAFEAEIGVKNITSNLIIGGNLFKRWISNLIEINLMSGFMIKPINIGKAEITGLELFFEYYFERLKFKNNLTILNGIETSDNSNWYGYPIIGQPLNLFNSTLEYQVLDNLNIFLEYLYRGNHYTTAGSLFKLPDQHTLNLGAGYNFTEKQKIMLNLNNLLNSYYYDNYGFPLPGFNAMASLLWVF